MTNIFRVCICSLTHPAGNAHAPYCHLWPAHLYTIFQHRLINGTILERKIEKSIEHKMCVCFSLHPSPEKFLSLKRYERAI